MRKMDTEMAEVGEEVTEVRNCTKALESDTKYIKQELVSMGTTVEALGNDLEELKHCALVNANHTEKNSNLLRDLGTKVDSIEEELNTKHLEVKEELASLQRDMNSSLYILQELKIQLINLREEDSVAHQRLLTVSCSELPSHGKSGYYWLRGSPEKVYCDMDRQSCGCGSTWGWMKVANIDMTDPTQQCPEGFRLRPETSKRMCETISETGGCTSIVFPTHSVQYSRVCGRVNAYQYASLEAFWWYYVYRSSTIDDWYVDGVSITHGQGTRKHIWTLVAAADETLSQKYTCPCTKTTTTYTGVVPPFVGNDYFCDTGSRQQVEVKLYSEDPLWDGVGCGPTSSCCQFNSPPWFCKELPQPTTDDIEVRVCRNRERDNESTPFELIDLYVQ